MKRFFNMFRTSKPVEKKSFDYSSYGSGFGFDSLKRLTPARALEYYTTVAPLFTGVNTIAAEVGSLDLAVMDKDTGELDYEHSLLELLRFPNADCVQYEFFVQLASFYKLTGNAFIVATGPINRPPLELYVVNPINIQLDCGSDGELGTIRIVSDKGESQEFVKQDIDGRYRFLSSDAEIWQIKAFSPRYGTRDHWGQSDLSSIVMELEQYYEASVHNLSQLKRGARPSGAIKLDSFVSDDQYQRLHEQLNKFYSGSHNAGRAMILEGGDFVQMSQTNKDMDFAALKKDITATIYNALKIPLPMISSEYSSYNNMETAKLNLYDNAVLPIAKRLLEELSVFLLDRYDEEGLELVYDLDTIEALEPRKNQELLKLKDSGVLTINELRMELGYEEIEGGDTLYIQSTMMPLGMADIQTEELLKTIDMTVDMQTKYKKCSHN